MIHIKKSASKTQPYYFVIKAKNGKILATSETYTSKEKCRNGIEAIEKLFDTQYYQDIIDKTKKK